MKKGTAKPLKDTFEQNEEYTKKKKKKKKKMHSHLVLNSEGSGQTMSI